MLAAVSQLGFPTNATPDYVLERRTILQMGHVPVQIHIMTSITGVDWENAWESRQPGEYARVPVFYLGRQALIDNKSATGRPKDAADVTATSFTS